MNLLEQITHQAAMLPRDVQAQVLDFVEYLVKKYATDAPTEDEAWDQLSIREAQVGGAKPGTR